jgi:hypothetical protein
MNDLTRKLGSLLAVIPLFLLAAPAESVQLFEGNLGYDGEWLHVQGSSAMSDRVYWYDLGTNISYRFELANDEGFSNVVLDVDGIKPNYIEPGVGPGFYCSRFRTTHCSPWLASRSAETTWGSSA